MAVHQRLIAVFCGLGLACLACHAADDQPGHGQWDSGAARPVCTAGGDQQSPALSLNDGKLLVVWQDGRPTGKTPDTTYPWSVYGRYPERGPEFAIHAPPDSSAMYPDVSGSYVVWQHHRGWNNLLMTTLNGEQPGEIKTIEGYLSSAPAIDGNLVVWASSKHRWESGKGNIAWITDIRAFELDGPGLAFDVTASEQVPQSRPAVSGTTVVWYYLRPGNSSYDSAFVDYRDLDRDPEPLRAAGIRTRKAMNCSISDILIVWQDNRNGDWDIYACDLGTGTILPVFVGPGNQTEPAVCGDVVVWTDDRDGDRNIYMNQRHGSTNVVE